MTFTNQKPLASRARLFAGLAYEHVTSVTNLPTKDPASDRRSTGLES